MSGPDWKSLLEDLKAQGIDIAKDQLPAVEKDVKLITDVLFKWAQKYVSSLPFPMSLGAGAVGLVESLLLKEEDKIDGIIGD